LLEGIEGEMYFELPESRVELRKLLDKSLDEAEFKRLVFDFGYNYDDLPGYSKSEKIVNFLLKLERLKKTHEFIEHILKEAPHLFK
jgi:hypothetical protein